MNPLVRYPVFVFVASLLLMLVSGRIGRAVAGLAAAFGMKVIANSRSMTGMDRKESTAVQFGDLESLFRQSDVVSLHCPLTPETKHMANAQRLSWMKPSAFLLNTSRGALIDEPALVDALEVGRIAGAGLDVLGLEPPPPDHPLLRARNCLVTPHIAWATRAARSRLLEIAVANVRAFLAGQPQNVVN